MSDLFKANGPQPTLFLTADYELFLGAKSGHIEDCLLEPTRRLTNLVERFNKNLVLFVDVFFLHRLEEDAATHPELAPRLVEVRSQLRRLVANGHHLGLHTHPQWLQARYTDGQWEFTDGAPLLLQDLPSTGTDPWRTIGGAMTQGRLLLESIAREAVAGYRVTCFRAGALCLQPFERLRAPLADNEIKIDSSIAPGCVVDDGPRRYDYRSAPEMDAWTFQENPLIPAMDGRFREEPVATFRPRFAEKLSNRVYHALANAAGRPWGNGLGRPMPKRPLFIRWMSAEPAVLTYDYWNAATILRQIRRMHSRGFQRVTLLGHPKFASPYSLTQLERILETARAEGWA